MNGIAKLELASGRLGDWQLALIIYQVLPVLSLWPF